MASAASGAWDGVAGGDLATLRRFLGGRVATLADRDALLAAVARSHRRPPPEDAGKTRRMLDNLDQDLFEAFQRGPSATHPTADDVVACAAEVLTAGSYDASAVTEAGEVAALVFLRRFVRASEMGSLFPAMAAERTAFAVQAVRNSVNPCSFVRLPPQRAGMVHVGGLYVLQLLATVVDGEFFIAESRMMALAALGGVAIASLDVLRRPATAKAIEIRLAPMQQFLMLHFEGHVNDEFRWLSLSQEYMRSIR